METIANITLENAQALLIEESFKRVVVVDFWADWCAPCKSLMPILEKLANEYQGAFLLAKVNADTENMIAAQFGVRSLPTVMLMKDGQPVDGFMGAKSETDVREFLVKYLPKPWERMLQQAESLLASGDFQQALPLLRQVYEESSRSPEVACLLAQNLVELKRLEEAEVVLQGVKLVDQDARYHQVAAQLQLKRQAAKTPELTALEEAYAREPDNFDIAYQLALQLHQEAMYRPALELLLTILQKNRHYGEGSARKTMTDIITSLGKGDPVAVEFQRKLFTLLY